MSFKIRRESSNGRGRIAALLVAMAVLSLGACRTVEQDEMSGWQNYSAAMSVVSDSSLWPESAEWRMGAESGNARIPKAGANFAVTIALWDPPTESVWVDLRKSGVRYARGVFVCEGTTRLKRVRQELDTLAAAIFRRIHPRTGACVFDSALAQALVDGDSLVRDLGFPANHPDGVDTAAVFRKAMLIMVAKEIPLAAIAPNWALGVDTLQIHTRIRALCEQGAVTDTSKIFPTPEVHAAPDRDGPNIAIVSPLAGKTLPADQDSLLVEARVADPSGVDSVWIDGVAARRTDTSWRAEKVFVPLSDSGTWILVRALDRAGNASVASVKVFRKDSTVVSPLPKPTARTSVLAPASGQLLTFDSAQAHVLWKVVDPFATVLRVSANGVAASRLSDSVWSADVPVPPSGARFIVKLVAVDSQDDSLFDSVVVVRAKDAQAPVLRRVAGSRGVGVDSASVFVSWSVSDNHKVSTVFVNDRAVTGNGGLYGAQVVLVEGSNLVRIRAVDSTGNVATDSVVVVRGAKDTLRPSLSRAAGTIDRTVSADTSAVVVAWNASDASLERVEIGGVAIAGAQGLFGRLVALATGRNVVRVEAVDSTGNVSTDSVVIVRSEKDTTRPVIVRSAGASNRKVRFDTASATVSWTASDAALKSVSIGGAVVQGRLGAYSTSIELAVGLNTVVISAIDSSGNFSTDSVVIERLARDSTSPVIIRSVGAVGRKVRFDTASATVSWTVSDAALKSVSIGGSTVQGSLGAYSVSVALVVGPNAVRISAVDSSGNVSTDSVVIERLARDSTSPVITRSAGAVGRKVRHDTVSATVSWTVSDAALKSVSIDGSAVQGSQGVYSAVVALLVGSNAVRISAIDSSGNVSTDSVLIVRLEKDTIAPVLVRAQGASNRTLRFDSLETTVSWRVTDEALRAVVIGSDTIVGAGDVYAAKVSLLGPTQRVAILAVDSFGNTARDTILLTKGVDTLAPSVTRVPGTADTTVTAETDHFAAHWIATDDGVLQSVTINGQDAISDGGVFFLDVPLDHGVNAITIVAYDGANHSATDTIHVTRP